MATLIYNGRVVAVGNFTESETEFASDVVYPKVVVPRAFLVDAEPQGVSPTGWGWDGQGFYQLPSPPPPPVPTVDEFVAAMDANFDAKAREKNYDNRITCALRAGYAGPFQAEGIAFAQWMDNSYAASYQILAAVQAGERTAPTTTAALLAELPQFDWANV